MNARAVTVFAVSITSTLLQAEGDGVSFRRDIAPLLLERCAPCHDAETTKGDYRVDSFERLLSPGRSEEPAVVAGDPEASRLYALIVETRERRRMPKDADALSPESVALVRDWIAGGARFDGPNAQAHLATMVTIARHPRPPEPYGAAVPVTALAFIATGEVAASGYHEVTVWSVENGELLRRFGNVEQRTQSLDVSPDRTLLAVAGGTPGRRGEVSLLALPEGALIRRLAPSSDVVLTARFSPAGDRLAVAHASGVVAIHDVASGAELRHIEHHADWVIDVAWSPDGTRLASASRDRTGKVFAQETGELLATYSGHDEAVLGVAFDPGGDEVWSSGRDRRIHRWSIADGKRKAEYGGFGGEVYAFVFTGGSIFAPSADGTIRQHEASSRREVRAYRGHTDWVHAAAVSGDGRVLASGSFDGEIRVWSTETGELLRAFPAIPPARAVRSY